MNKAGAGTLRPGVVVLKTENHPQNLESGPIALVSPNKVRDATYSAVLAALRTATIKQPFTNPARAGSPALSRAITTIEFVLGVFIDGIAVEFPAAWVLFRKVAALSRLPSPGNDGSSQLTFM